MKPRKKRYYVSVRGEVYDRLKAAAKERGVMVSQIVEAASDGSPRAPGVDQGPGEG